MNYKIGFWLLLVISGVLFFFPISTSEAAGLGLDKLVHIILFAILLYAGVRAFHSDSVAVLLALYSLAVELIQGWFLPFRSFDWWDMLAGWLGIVIVYLLMINGIISFDKKRK